MFSSRSLSSSSWNPCIARRCSSCVLCSSRMCSYLFLCCPNLSLCSASLYFLSGLLIASYSPLLLVVFFSQESSDSHKGVPPVRLLRVRCTASSVVVKTNAEFDDTCSSVLGSKRRLSIRSSTGDNPSLVLKNGVKFPPLILSLF